MPNIGYDLQRTLVSGLSIAPERRSANVNGSGVNLGESEGPVTAITMIGRLSNQVLTLALSLTESTNDNTADAFGAADAYAAMSPAASASYVEPGVENTLNFLTTMSRSERYVRAEITHTGSVLQNIFGVGLVAKSKSY